MVERIRIGTAGRPLSVLDASGNIDPLACLFDANYKPLRGILVKGVIAVRFRTLGTVSLGVTLAKPPFYLCLQWSGISYNGLTRIESVWNDWTSDGTSRGSVTRSYTNRLEFYPYDAPATFSNVNFYYAALKNELG